MEFCQQYLLVVRLKGEFEIYDMTKKDPLDIQMNFFHKHPCCYQELEEIYQTRDLDHEHETQWIEQNRIFQINETTKVKQMERRISHMKISKDKKWIAVSIWSRYEIEKEIQS